MTTSKDNDEKTVRNIVEGKIADPVTRHHVLQIMAEGINEANIYGRNIWTVTCTDSLRLFVNHYQVIGSWTSTIFLALDKEAYESERYGITADKLEKWGWRPDVAGEKDALPNYMDSTRTNQFSVNGMFDLRCFDEHWPDIRHLFFSFLYKAARYGQPMLPQMRKNHCPAALSYIRNELGVHVPDPLL